MNVYCLEKPKPKTKQKKKTQRAVWFMKISSLWASVGTALGLFFYTLGVKNLVLSAPCKFLPHGGTPLLFCWLELHMERTCLIKFSYWVTL